MNKSLSIVILSDSDSWINPTVELLVSHWIKSGHNVFWQHEVDGIGDAELCFCLSFGQLVPRGTRQRFRHTLVVHESDLPQGKGWSPLTWQILEGINRIPVTLIEAAEKVDSGKVYAQQWIDFDGYELIDELRAEQGRVTLDLCKSFVDNYPSSALLAKDQIGVDTFYRRRTPCDSELDVNKSISEQFNLLRVVDSTRYPAFFDLDGRRYYLTISKKKPS